LTDEFALLSDLARLVRKHGPNTFGDLAKLLADPDGIGELIGILEAAQHAGRQARVPEPRPIKRRGAGSAASSRKFLAEVERTQPDKAEVLSRLYDAFQAKQVLPSISEVRRFGEDNGLPAIRATSRDRAITSLLRHLAAYPTSDVRMMLARLDVAPRRGDRTLEGWTDVILGTTSRRDP
jgi:hypothetical protein